MGSYVGFETNPAAWTFLGQDTGVVPLLADGATPVDVGASFVIPAGATYGLYVDLASYDTTASLQHTNGSATCSDGFLQLDLGIGRGAGFASAIFTPRIWNGSIYYSVAAIPEPSTLAIFGAGVGLVLIARRRRRRAA